MKQPGLTALVVVTALATAAVHAYLATVMRPGEIDLMFTLNALGYVSLLIAWLLPALAAFRRVITIAFIVYTLVTILGWLAIGDKTSLLGWADKAIEVVLLATLGLTLRRHRS
jgi:hypothetical protein